MRISRVLAQGRLLALAAHEVAGQLGRRAICRHDVAADTELPPDEAEAVPRREASNFLERSSE